MEQALKEFEKYTDNYKSYGEMIELKIKHTKRVTDIASSIADSLKLSKEEKEVATLCGLLHDIGRFEQYKNYQTYDDKKSIDHGDLGYKILKEKDYLSVYTKNEKYKNSILKSVKYHNKYIVPKNLSKQDKLFCNIARDADKIDILYIFTDKTTERDIFKADSNNTKMSKEVLETLKGHKSISHEILQTKADRISICLGFIFDINYPYSFKYLKESNYMNIIIDKMKNRASNKEFQEQLEEVRDIINNYIEVNSKC